MNSNSDDFVAAIAVFGIFVMPILGWVIVRYLRHLEHLAMIRAGMQPPIKMSGRDWRNAAQQQQGMAGMQMPPPSSYRQQAGRRKSCDDDFSAAGQRIALHKGIRLAFIGMALTIGLSFIGYSDSSIGPMWHPGPWLLGGLIPLFIGLAQISSAVLAGASFSPSFSQPTQPGPAFGDPTFGVPQPPPPFGTPPTYDASYTYRPGETTELRPPPMPPDRR